MSPHGKSVVLEPMGNSSQINLNFYENQALNPIIHLSCIFSYVKSRYYRDIATAILKRFPHLVKESIRYADTVDLWYGIIIHTDLKIKKMSQRYWRGGAQIKKVNYKMKM